MNQTTRRFPRRSMAEPWRGTFTHYRAPFLSRWGHVIATVLTLAVFAALGILLAWRG